MSALIRFGAKGAIDSSTLDFNNSSILTSNNYHTAIWVGKNSTMLSQITGENLLITQYKLSTSIHITTMCEEQQGQTLSGAEAKNISQSLEA